MGQCASEPVPNPSDAKETAKSPDYAKNKVVPESVAERDECGAQSNGLGALLLQRQEAPDPHAAGEALERFTFLKELSHACANEAACSNLYLSLKQLSPKAPQFLVDQEKGGVCDKHALKLAAVSCATCLDRIYEPIVTRVERLLSNDTPTTSKPITNGTTEKTPQWGSLTAEQVLATLDDAAKVIYPKECISLHNLGKASLPAAEILLLLWEYCSKQSTLPIGPDAFHVPAIDRFASLLGIAWYKKFTLEPQPVLDERAHHLAGLLSRLYWHEQHFACCLSPSLAAMMMQVQQASQKGAVRVDFTVNRSHAFWDAFKQAESKGLLKSGNGSNKNMFGGQVHLIFPLFVEGWAEDAARKGAKPIVEAGEGHGPRKEFFQLAGTDMCKQEERMDSQKPLFVHNRTAGTYWYNTNLKEDTHYRSAFRFAGWLMGQSLLNRAPLNMSLPALLFRQVLHQATRKEGFQPNLEMLEQYDPHAAAAIKNVANLPKAQLAELLAMEGSEGLTVEQYQQKALTDLLVGATKWQADALRDGLLRVLGTELVSKWCLGPETLAMAVAGTEGVQENGGPVDMRTVFRVVMDDELSPGGGGEVVGELLWEVLNSWSVELQTAFLNFATGTTRLPAPGSELLKVECPFVAISIAESKQHLGMLPQAHTCDNLLEVPNYWEALLQVKGIKGGGADLLKAEQLALRAACRNIVDQRLRTAVIEGSQGYGLDQRAEPSSPAQSTRLFTPRDNQGGGATGTSIDGLPGQEDLGATGGVEIAAPRLGRGAKSGQEEQQQQQQQKDGHGASKSFFPPIAPAPSMRERAPAGSPAAPEPDSPEPAEEPVPDKLQESTVSIPNTLEETTWAERSPQQQQQQLQEDMPDRWAKEQSTDQGAADDSDGRLPMLDSAQGPSWGKSGCRQDPCEPAPEQLIMGPRDGQTQGGGRGTGEITTLVLEDDDEEEGAGHQQAKSREQQEGGGHEGSKGIEGHKSGKHVVDDRVHAFSGSDEDIDKLIAEGGKQGSH